MNRSSGILGKNRAGISWYNRWSIAFVWAVASTFNVEAEELPDASATTESANIDKSGYHLFNRTPKAEMREMSTDRPDKTESAYTVDAGHFQLEMDFIAPSMDHESANGSDIQTDAWGVAPVNLKLGLLNNTDLQVVLNTYDDTRTENRGTGITTREKGFGGITTRLKVNLWGNDGGKTALAVMPFVEFPARAGRFNDNLIQGGVIFPLAVSLPGDWGMGLMTEFDINRNDEDDHVHGSFINSVTFSHDIYGKLGGYVEFFSEVSSLSDEPWVGTVDCGLTYALTPNTQLDGGVNIGVTPSAPDVQYFLGLSLRF